MSKKQTKPYFRLFVGIGEFLTIVYLQLQKPMCMFFYLIITCIANLFLLMPHFQYIIIHKFYVLRDIVFNK